MLTVSPPVLASPLLSKSPEPSLMIFPAYDPVNRAALRASHAAYRALKDANPTQPDVTTTSRTYNLGTENSLTMSARATQIASDGTYLFLSMRDGKGVNIRSFASPATLHTSIIPAGFIDGSNDYTITNMSYANGKLAFITKDTLYVYSFTSHTDYSLDYSVTVASENMRAVHIDYNADWVYFGGFTGKIYAHEVGSDTYTTYSSFHSGEMRFFSTFNDTMLSVSNDDTINRLSRSDRNSITSQQSVDEGLNIEVCHIDNEYIIYGADTQTIEVTQVDNLSTSVASLTNPTDDVTSVVRDFQYLSASDDAGNVFVYDTSNSFSLESSFAVAGTNGIESSLIYDGELFYIGKNSKFYYRSYLND